MIVSEIFRSLRVREEPGAPLHLHQFVGCNLRCAWCDTLYAHQGGEEMTVAQILDRIWLMNGKHICITGGEPLLWAEEVLDLLKKFDIHGYTVEIETNGTLDFREMQPYASICMDVKCPSSGREQPGALRHITPATASSSWLPMRPISSTPGR